MRIADKVHVLSAEVTRLPESAVVVRGTATSGPRPGVSGWLAGLGALGLLLMLVLAAGLTLMMTLVKP